MLFRPGKEVLVRGHGGVPDVLGTRVLVAGGFEVVRDGLVDWAADVKTVTDVKIDCSFGGGLTWWEYLRIVHGPIDARVS